MEILKKINQARQKIRSSDLKKLGYNKFSNYDYYTPEQVDKLVNDACKDLNLFNKYQLLRTEFGLIAQIEVIDLDSNEKELFIFATDIPQIKATNVAQQLGGAVTYSNRYLLMSIYGIVDNNLDFDANDQDKTKQPDQPKGNKQDDEKPWLNKWLDKGETKLNPQYDKIIEWAKKQNMEAKDLRQHYKISNKILSELEKDLIKPTNDLPFD